MFIPDLAESTLIIPSKLEIKGELFSNKEEARKQINRGEPTHHQSLIQFQLHSNKSTFQSNLRFGEI